MNAAGQRRLTSWLLAICGVLAALCALLLAGMGRGVHWEAPMPPQAVPSAHVPSTISAAPPLAAYAAIWRHPLFTTTREPARVPIVGQVKSTSLDNMELTGVILAPGMHIALLSDRRDGHTAQAREGAHFAGSPWILKSLQPRSAVFVDGGRRTRLTLSVPGAGSVSSTASTPAGQAHAREHPSPVMAPQPDISPDREAQRVRIQAIRRLIEQRRHKKAPQAGGH